MATGKPEPKIGAGHASAMYRQGLAELRGAMYPDSNVAQPAQYGLYGTRTAGEVMQERGTYGGNREEQSHSIVEERAGDIEKEDRSHEREPPEPERE